MPKTKNQEVRVKNHKNSTKKEKIENLPEKLVEFINSLPTRAKKGYNAKQDTKKIKNLYNKRNNENFWEFSRLISPYLYDDERCCISSWDDLSTHGIRKGPRPLVPLYTENGTYIGEPMLPPS